MTPEGAVRRLKLIRRFAHWRFARLAKRLAPLARELNALDRDIANMERLCDIQAANKSNSANVIDAV